MLPGLSGCMGELLIGGEVRVGERAADLTEDLGGGNGVCPGIGVRQQWWEGLTGMRVGDGPAQRSPEPLDTIGLGIIGGGVDQHQLTPQFLQQRSHQERALGGVGAQVVQQHQRDPATRLGTLDRSAQLSTQRRGRALGRTPPVEPPAERGVKVTPRSPSEPCWTL